MHRDTQPFCTSQLFTGVRLWVRLLTTMKGSIRGVAMLLALRPSAVLGARVGSVEPLPSMVWMAPVMNPGGFSSEAQSYAGGLARAYDSAGRHGHFGLRQFAEWEAPGFAAGLPAEFASTLRELLAAGRSRKRWDVAVCHSPPDVWHADGAFGWGRTQPCPPPRARFSVGRIMFETDRLPASWVPRINRMDEVWVPSGFAVDQFVSSGVDPSKIFVVPEAVDTEFFDPGRHAGASEDRAEFRFLSVFKWERRKGWDVLLRAYFEEFSGDDPVSLSIKTQAFHTAGADFEAKVRDFAEAMGAAARRPLARFSVSADDVALAELPRLYASADAFVLPTRGEGWGRPLVEAMSMGLPVIATNWSGQTAFLSEGLGCGGSTAAAEERQSSDAPSPSSTTSGPSRGPLCSGREAFRHRGVDTKPHAASFVERPGWS